MPNKPKINKQVKDTWTQLEVVELLEKVFKEGMEAQKHLNELPTPRVRLAEFIKNNM